MTPKDSHLPEPVALRSSLSCWLWVWPCNLLWLMGFWQCDSSNGLKGKCASGPALSCRWGFFLPHVNEPTPAHTHYTTLSLANVLLFSYRNLLSGKGLNSFMLHVKFNDSLSVLDHFNFKVTSTFFRIWKSEGEVIRNMSEELLLFPAHVLRPLTSPPSRLVFEREVDLGGKDMTNDRNSLTRNKIHFIYTSWVCSQLLIIRSQNSFTVALIESFLKRFSHPCTLPGSTAIGCKQRDKPSRVPRKDPLKAL